MYKCLDCGAIFTEPENYSEDRTPGGVFEGGSFIEHYTGCPMCSRAYEAVQECDMCGEWTFENCLNYCEYGSICDECYQSIYEDEDD